MDLVFTRPGWMILLVLVIPLWWIDRRGLVDLPPLQRRGSLLVRAVLLSCIVGALGGCTLGRSTDLQSVVFVLDRSASVDAAGLQRAWERIRRAIPRLRTGDQAVLLQFAGEVVAPVRLAEPLGDAPPDLPAGWPGGATDIAHALDAALAHLEPGRGRRVVLATDGWATTADPSPRLTAMAAEGVRVDVLSVPSATNAEVQVSGVSAPARTHEGEPFALDIEVQSTVETPATLQVYMNGVASHREDVKLTAGSNRFSLRQVAGDERVMRYRVALAVEEDTWIDNNEGLAIVRSEGKPSVLLIESRPQDGRHLRWAMESEDIVVELRSPRGVPRSLAELQQLDLLAFSDIAAHEITENQMQMIRNYVRDLGGGFLMLGSDRSFGLGGYYKSVLEEILPVRTDFEREREHPSLAMVLVIDKSGSMGGTKLELAKEAARATAELLDARDQLGVVAFDGQSRWVCELLSAADRDYIQERIGSLQSGGGTDMGPALAAAYRGLETAVAKLKHVIVLTDGHSSPANFYDLVSGMRSSGITVSSVGVGQGADRDLLDRIANWGDGRYYFTSDPLSIPQIFARETITASRSALQETPFLAQPVLPHPSIRGLDLEAAPFLLGYVITRPKPTSDLVLITEAGHPLLAFWRYGLGRVGAFTSDARNRWAAEWLEWPEFSSFWAQTMRSLMRDRSSAGMQVRVTGEAGMLEIAADVPAVDDVAASLPALTATLIGPDLQPTDVVLRAVAPERYRASVPAPRTGEYQVQVTREISGVVTDRADAGYASGYPDEYRIREADTGRLRAWAEAGGGVVDPDPDTWFGEERVKGVQRSSLAPALLSAAVLLLILDVFLRRILL